MEPEDRRRAWRLTLAGAGWLSARDFRAACIVENISAFGAKVAVTLLVVGSLELVPDRLTLTTTLGAEQIALSGAVLRVEHDGAGAILGIAFQDADTTELSRLISSVRSDWGEPDPDPGGEG